MNDATQRITLRAERLRPLDDGFRVQWNGKIRQGDKQYERRFTTRCSPDGLVEMPLDGLVRGFVDRDRSPVCRYPTELDAGLVMRGRTTTRLGNVERACAVTRTGVRVRSADGTVMRDAVEIAVTERGSVGNREVSARSTRWLTPELGIVRARLESGMVELVRAP